MRVAIITSFGVQLYGRRRAKRKTEQVLAALQQNGSSHEPKATGEDTKKRQRKKKTKQTLTHAVTHIRLIEANPGKLDALDQLVVLFQALCHQYITLFCTAATSPDKYADPVFESELSQR